MPDDRLGDLGTDRPSAAERFEELDQVPEPESGKRPEDKDPSSIANRYTWVVGIAALVVVVIALVNSAGNPGRGYLGLKAGSEMPAFAAPLASSGSQADANIRAATGGDATQGPVPACEVDDPQALNICNLQDKPIVLTFVTEGCEEQLDTVEDVRSEFPDVNFVGVISDVNNPQVPAQLVAAGEWGFPVAADNDAAVFNLYRSGDCPTTFFMREGGLVHGSSLGYLESGALSARVRDLTRAADGT